MLNLSNKIKKFAFVGGFGDCRGLQELVIMWYNLKIRHELYLQGPDNQYKCHILNLKESKLLIRKKILFFPEPVSEQNIVNSMKKYDIGLIPYTPICINNKYCCPNKLSQYMKAGLAIYSNKLPEVESIILRSRAGKVCDFSNPKTFKKKITQITTNTKNYQKNARKYFYSTYNWQNASKNFYKILEKIKNKKRLGLAPERKIPEYSFADYYYQKLQKQSLKIKTKKNIAINEFEENNLPQIYPLANSRELVFSLFCLFCAKVFYLFFRNKPPKFVIKKINSIFSNKKISIGIQERYYFISNKLRLSPF